MLITNIKLLIISVRQLGIVTGLRYFRCYLRALKHPEFTLEWAESCEKYARKLEFFNADDPVAIAARNWAQTLREYAKCKN